ncbi:MAG: hypothetical protein AMS27_03650 [Bacteroides sp. SM23_62_1]|nr:MAG: hypothetical protein AMS27_03650 [Bacteroides sp. SM23_62_1]
MLADKKSENYKIIGLMVGAVSQLQFKASGRARKVFAKTAKCWLTDTYSLCIPCFLGDHCVKY